MRIKTLLTTVFVAVMLVIAADYTTYAATGGSFLLGKSNAANAETALSRTTAGTTLRLNSQPGSPPLVVNRNVKATNLNADFVDGLNAAALQTSARRYSLPAKSSNQPSYTFSGLAPGIYLASYHVNAATTGTMDCWIYTANSPVGYTLFNGGGNRQGTWFAAASGSVDTRGAAASLHCYGGDGGGIVSVTQPSEIVFTRVDALVDGTASRLAPSAERVVPGAPR